MKSSSCSYSTLSSKRARVYSSVLAFGVSAAIGCSESEAGNPSLAAGAASGGNPSSGKPGTGGSGAGGEGGAKQGQEPPRKVLGSIVIDADGNRVSYAQIVGELSGHFTNRDGIEVSGNANFLTHGSDFFYGLAESPEWVRYSTENGFRETGRLSFLNFGMSYIDFANAIVDDETAVSVLTEAYVAVVWNPKSMKIKGTIDLAYLKKDGFSLEAFTTVAHEGLVYVPAKWVNWETPEVLQVVHLTVLDPSKLEVVTVAEDSRCGAGGRVTFDAAGYAYVMGDGRNQSMQTFAAAAGRPTVPNCLLRMVPGEAGFEPDYSIQIPALTGGLDSMTELQPADIDSGVAFSMLKYEERIPEGLDRINFEHWGVPAYKLWRFTLGSEPRAEEVQGADFSVVGFPAAAFAGKLYSSESSDGSSSTVFEIDPATNRATRKFTMDGYFAALLPLDDKR
ncbi:MAG TPA: hypothetical protein VFQ61_36570 [Polyangiaceae bacterium]|nr:hypothetical protein [Polyangiaceae bacterium]